MIPDDFSTVYWVVFPIHTQKSAEHMKGRLEKTGYEGFIIKPTPKMLKKFTEAS